MKAKTKNYLLIGSIAVLFTAVGLLYGARSEGVNAQNEHTLTTRKGKTIHVKVDGKRFTTDAADGSYKLTNGGAIRVRRGIIVWDAFGTVKSLRDGHWRGAYVNPEG